MSEQSIDKRERARLLSDWLYGKEVPDSFLLKDCDCGCNSVVKTDREELEVEAANCIRSQLAEVERLCAELEAVKRGQGEPVGIIVRESYGNSVALNGPGDALPVGAALYTSAPQPAAAIDERAEFNREFDEICCRPITGREMAWRMWQARAKLNAQPVPAVPEGWRIRSNTDGSIALYGPHEKGAITRAAIYKSASDESELVHRLLATMLAATH